MKASLLHSSTVVCTRTDREFRLHFAQFRVNYFFFFPPYFPPCTVQWRLLHGQVFYRPLYQPGGDLRLFSICGWWPSGRGGQAFGLPHRCLAPPSNPASKPHSHTVLSTTKPCLLTCYSPGGGTAAFMICAHGTVEFEFDYL